MNWFENLVDFDDQSSCYGGSLESQLVRESVGQFLMQTLNPRSWWLHTVIPTEAEQNISSRNLRYSHNLIPCFTALLGRQMGWLAKRPDEFYRHIDAQIAVVEELCPFKRVESIDIRFTGDLLIITWRFAPPHRHIDYFCVANHRPRAGIAREYGMLLYWLFSHAQKYVDMRPTMRFKCYSAGQKHLRLIENIHVIDLIELLDRTFVKQELPIVIRPESITMGATEINTF